MMTDMSKYKFPIALARNTVWMLFGQGLRLVIRALYFVEIARSLGATNYGAFIGVVALVGIASPFGDLGSGSLLVKNVSRDRSLFASYWGKGLVATFGASSALITIVFLLSAFALPSSIPRHLVLLVAVSDLLGLNLITVCGEAFQAFDRLNWTAAINALDQRKPLNRGFCAYCNPSASIAAPVGICLFLQHYFRYSHSGVAGLVETRVS